MIKPEYLAARPEDIGIDSERLEAVFARAKRDVDQGALPSAQVAVGRNGKVAGIRTFGKATHGGVEAPPITRRSTSSSPAPRPSSRLPRGSCLRTVC